MEYKKSDKTRRNLEDTEKTLAMSQGLLDRIHNLQEDIDKSKDTLNSNLSSMYNLEKKYQLKKIHNEE